ncbi:sensor histidine kinase [Streptomyces hoynatensis]|uniref:histidine kinase n=2 Tax=Streptomyces hoynatensis TaxID=1141874 RepID=A0A3A9YUD8_9ACTN|nr:sensor histidine kinase [Streptomyces hoynatensis]
MVSATGVVLTALTYLLLRRRLGGRLGFYLHDTAGEPGAPPLPELPASVSGVRDVTLSAFLTQSALALALLTVPAALVAWLVAGRVLRPLRSVSATARRLSAENLSERVPVGTPTDELTALSATINDMLDRIQRGIAERDRALHSQRMFAANAAHELRTPLATMRTALDVTLEGEPDRAELLAMAADISAAVTTSRRTLDGLLLLARSQAGPGARRPVDLAGLVTAALGARAEEVRALGLGSATDLRPAVVWGEPVLLERLVDNLVGNAVRHNHPGGHLAAATGTAGGEAYLRLANSGPPIAAEETAALLEPFVRGVGARLHAEGGSGLGLSLVQAVVTAHDGRLIPTPRPGGGLVVTVLLPAASPAAPSAPADLSAPAPPSAPPAALAPPR